VHSDSGKVPRAMIGTTGDPAQGPARSGSVARRVGVCSWSLQPRTVHELVARVQATGQAAVQLALDPVRNGAMAAGDVTAALRTAGITVLSGMMAMEGEDYSTLESIRRTGGVVPDEAWPRNRDAAAANAALARSLGVRLVTLHAGFLPHAAADPRRAVLLGRVRELARIFADAGVTLALETGQETAQTLLEVLDELRDVAVGINFDPANMILYGMGDPVAALRLLAPFVRQVHVKDALPAAMPGTWGTEVVAGTGAVDWASFFRVLDERGIRADLLIEREAGADRVGDISAAGALIRRYSPAPASGSGCAATDT
jgi:L-ribulose-5-phosphate 3-epimerase